MIAHLPYKPTVHIWCFPLEVKITLDNGKNKENVHNPEHIHLVNVQVNHMKAILVESVKIHNFSIYNGYLLESQRYCDCDGPNYVKKL